MIDAVLAILAVISSGAIASLLGIALSVGIICLIGWFPTESQRIADSHREECERKLRQESYDRRNQHCYGSSRCESPKSKHPTRSSDDDYLTTILMNDPS